MPIHTCLATRRNLELSDLAEYPDSFDYPRAAIQIFAALSFSIGVGCASSPTISFDANAAWSHFRTWDWAPIGTQTADTPNPDFSVRNRDIARLVAHALAQRGFARHRRAPDLRVDARLSVQREHVMVTETGAVEHLSSLHSSPSYQVQATTQRLETYERTRLVMMATDTRRGLIVWKGALEQRFRGQFSRHLESMVETLMEHFPPAAKFRHEENDTSALASVVNPSTVRKATDQRQR